MTRKKSHLSTSSISPHTPPSPLSEWNDNKLNAGFRAFLSYSLLFLNTNREITLTSLSSPPVTSPSGKTRAKRAATTAERPTADFGSARDKKQTLDERCAAFCHYRLRDSVIRALTKLKKQTVADTQEFLKTLTNARNMFAAYTPEDGLSQADIVPLPSSFLAPCKL